MFSYPAGSNDGMQRCSQFTILDDVTAGPNSFRFLIIDLINVVGGSLGNPPTTTVKILDDDGLYCNMLIMPHRSSIGD